METNFTTDTPAPYFFETGGGIVFCVSDGVVYRWTGDNFTEVALFVNAEPV